jgi:hypothetical protein
MLVVPHQAAFIREDHRLYPVAQVELGENAVDVRAYRARGKVEVLPDLGVGAAAGDQRQYLAFPWG